ncbi:hypothetical protein LNKW23_02430 [Paralimibaculum aggregatum]|uniref:DUF302 domain-containing protein n=1 Tax=Paralimibaculum aggregatum TaxID=3036245 RepID=A0ABQ6LCE7_9RHOB|nr:DUF302 domain-containing protein [Limibaculum sp. NKW23]GMG81031.1 hypothetical protein LNKW23_02430 [Limibaculum sp. NKW23]
MRPPRLAALLLLVALPAAAEMAPRDGWAVHPTPHAYETLLERLRAAVRAEKMGLVTEAGPTGAAASRGIEIPGNRVVGVFRNDFAVRAVRLSTAAMIEAPIRFYVTENADGTATLSYKTPSFVFTPYVSEGGDELAALAGELDTIFAAIAARAAAE